MRTELIPYFRKPKKERIAILNNIDKQVIYQTGDCREMKFIHNIYGYRFGEATI